MELMMFLVDFSHSAGGLTGKATMAMDGPKAPGLMAAGAGFIGFI